MMRWVFYLVCVWMSTCQGQDDESKWICKPQDAALYPDINIIGLPKAGTSYVYRLLVSNDAVLPSWRQKEHCPRGRNTSDPQGLDAYFNEIRHHLQVTQSSAQKLHVNGCPDHDLNMAVRRCVGPYLSSQPKYIICLREPADYLWAVYNFWSDEYDAPWTRSATNPTWTSKSSYRTPEMFHELVLAGNRTVATPHLKVFEDMVAHWLMDIRQWRKLVGAGNVLVLKLEDLSLPKTRQTLASFLHIPNAFAMPASTIVNAGTTIADRGDTSVVPTDTVRKTSGLYEVSGFKPMLPRTRSLIHRMNHKGCCMLLKKEAVDLGCCHDNA